MFFTTKENQHLRYPCLFGMVLKNQNMILWMDADGSIPAKSVKDMVKILMENQDSVIIGSRFRHGGAYKNT